mmetsp:Transcript_16124/g.33227  ORF Transcript_16124/g.33227 Transcript_16124/m.33227 type:complete len:149 (-) Transcript_16124:94-540(-)
MQVLRKKAAMREKDLATTTHDLGVRIVGMKYFDSEKGDFVKHDKPWGKALTKQNIQQSLLSFFNSEASKNVTVPAVVEKLREIEAVMEKQQKVRIYSSSILIAYDSAEDSDYKPRVRMIDFAHVHDITDGGHDEGYITGIKNFIHYLS